MITLRVRELPNRLSLSYLERRNYICYFIEVNRKRGILCLSRNIIIPSLIDFSVLQFVVEEKEKLSIMEQQYRMLQGKPFQRDKVCRRSCLAKVLNEEVVNNSVPYHVWEVIGR